MSVVVRTAQHVATNVGARIEHTTNRLLPPDQRERALEHLRAFSVRNPKLASFLAAQSALAGLPILLFLAFAIATLLVSLATCILLAVIAALVFTLLATGFALLFVVPVVFIGSCTATIAFLWGLIGYLVLQRINGGETLVQPGTNVGDTLNELTGGRLRPLGDGAASDQQQEKLAVGSSQDEKVPMGREGGHRDYEARRRSPRRQSHGQTNGTGHSREVGEDSEENGARGAEIGTRHAEDGEPGSREFNMSTYGPGHESVVDWKTEFQQEGLTA